jgi:hypothetical protein
MTILLLGVNDTEGDYQESLLYLKELIQLHERHNRILWFAPFAKGNAITARKGDSVTGEVYDGLLEQLKSLQEDITNRNISTEEL